MAVVTEIPEATDERIRGYMALNGLNREIFAELVTNDGEHAFTPASIEAFLDDAKFFLPEPGAQGSDPKETAQTG
jgi:hypothetical protein